MAMAGLLVFACTQEASHMPPLPLLPFEYARSVAANAVYDSRRERVARFIAANRASLAREAATGGGPVVSELFETARVPSARHERVIAEMRHDAARYFGQDTADGVEALTVLFMVNGN